MRPSFPLGFMSGGWLTGKATATEIVAFGDQADKSSEPSIMSFFRYLLLSGCQVGFKIVGEIPVSYKLVVLGY